MNNTWNTDANGNAIDVTKTRASVYFIQYIMPRMAKLAKGNPRFNRYINPLYYLGTDSPTTTGPHLDDYKDIGGNTGELATQTSRMNQVLGKVGSRDNYNIPTAQWKTAKSYDELFIPVTNVSKYPSYWASIMPSDTQVNLLGIVNSTPFQMRRSL